MKKIYWISLICVIVLCLFLIPILHAKESESKAMTKKCPTCNKVYSEDTKFCSEDGTKLVESLVKMICPDCKKEGAPKEKFCKEHGKKLIPHTETPPVRETDAGEERKETSSVEQSPDDNETTEPIDDDVLIKGTIAYAKDLVVPPYDVKITYDKKTISVYVKFRTPVPYILKYDFSDIWDRWRFNQWIVLQEFKKAKIPVSEVTVETNHHDGSGIMKTTHSAEHIDKYAKLTDENLWLRTGTFYQKEIGSDKWERIDN